MIGSPEKVKYSVNAIFCVMLYQLLKLWLCPIFSTKITNALLYSGFLIFFCHSAQWWWGSTVTFVRCCAYTTGLVAKNNIRSSRALFLLLLHQYCEAVLGIKSLLCHILLKTVPFAYFNPSWPWSSWRELWHPYLLPGDLRCRDPQPA